MFFCTNCDKDLKCCHKDYFIVYARDQQMKDFNKSHKVSEI